MNGATGVPARLPAEAMVQAVRRGKPRLYGNVF